MKVPSSTLVLVADGRVALFMRNHGDALSPRLEVERTIENEVNPPTRAQGSERPGRVYSSSGTARSAVEQTDFHEQSEAEFAGKIAAELTRMRAEAPSDPLIVVAPPRMLGKLRQALRGAMPGPVLAELDKDLTKHPLKDIEALLLEA